MKVSFLTLGCKLNYAETSTYERGFVNAGWEIVKWTSSADIYIVNTCSVTAVADAKSRNLLRKVHRVNPSAPVIAVGCSAQLRREELERIPGVALVVGCNQKADLVSAAIALSEGRCPHLCDRIEPFKAYSSGERTRCFLKVQDGCNNYCAYCTVPFARGESRNVPIADCVAQAHQAAASGIKEIVLTGVNTGDYGRTTGESFLDLLKALDQVDGIERYRISSIEPNLLTDEIIDWIASGTKFQPHFHIPLQSGNDEILSRMGRRYSTSFFASRLARIRAAMEGEGKPLVFFGIDLMTGLPGETDEIFQQELEYLRSLKPAFIHVFPYSKRPGTPAATMPDQVPEEIKKQRTSVIEDLCAELHTEFILANAGIKEKVLFESTDKSGMMAGYTGNYIRVERPYCKALSGMISDVVLTGQEH